MRMSPNVATSLAEVKKRVRRCVLLYSGGLDSSFFIWWAKQNGIDVVAINVILDHDSYAGAAKRAKMLGAEYRALQKIDCFVRDYVSHSIRANACYQHVFPVSSSLSRPLIAACGVEVAKTVGADAVVHTAGAHQNSCARFNNAIAALSPEVRIANPLIEDDVPRQEKYRLLRQDIPLSDDAIYSVDSNIWARVIENADLDSVANAVPARVFKLTANPWEVEREPTDVVISYDHGLPFALDGKSMSTKEIIGILNQTAGAYGIGRYNGVEDTWSMLKNHEIREAPAAAVLLTAHRHLEQLTLTADELRVKNSIDYEWVSLAVRGLWFSDLFESLTNLLTNLSKPVTGEVTVRLAPGGTYVLSIASPYSLGMETPLASAVLNRASDTLAASRLDALDRQIRLC